jgi:tetratricopeptide (TPR) repeat protein
LGKDDPLALCTAGVALYFVARNQKDAEALIERALALNPNLAWAWLFSAWVKLWTGEPETAIERLHRSLRLSPNDPHSFNIYSAMAVAHFFAARYAQAVSWAEMALRERPHYLLPMLVAAASSALAGLQQDAERAMAQARMLDPGLSIASVRELFFPSRPDDVDRWEEGLRLAGLPE